MQLGSSHVYQQSNLSASQWTPPLPPHGSVCEGCKWCTWEGWRLMRSDISLWAVIYHRIQEAKRSDAQLLESRGPPAAEAMNFCQISKYNLCKPTATVANCCRDEDSLLTSPECFFTDCHNVLSDFIKIRPCSLCPSVCLSVWLWGCVGKEPVAPAALQCFPICPQFTSYMAIWLTSAGLRNETILVPDLEVFIIMSAAQAPGGLSHSGQSRRGGSRSGSRLTADLLKKCRMFLLCRGWKPASRLHPAMAAMPFLESFRPWSD